MIPNTTEFVACSMMATASFESRDVDRSLVRSVRVSACRCRTRGYRRALGRGNDLSHEMEPRSERVVVVVLVCV